MCNCSTWHKGSDFECCCPCHGSSDERQDAANNHARRLGDACHELVTLRSELAGVRAKVEEAVALHFRDEEKWDVDERKGWLKIPVCAACGEQYPCPTLAILAPQDETRSDA